MREKAIEDLSSLISLERVVFFFLSLCHVLRKKPPSNEWVHDGKFQNNFDTWPVRRLRGQRRGQVFDMSSIIVTLILTILIMVVHNLSDRLLRTHSLYL